MSMVPWKGRISSRLLSQFRMRKRRSRTKRERKQQKDKEKNCFTDVKQNVSVVVFAQQRVLRRAQSVMKSRNQHVTKLVILMK